MMRFARVISVLIAVAAATCIASPASAYIYAGKRKKINCGILVVPGAAQPLDAGTAAGNVGDLFYLLDRREDLKPAGWSLDNPLAPGSPSTGLGKNNPAYWKIDLSAVRSLSRMHLLYLPASGSVSLSEENREKLRQFVDGGGVLWIDNTGSGSRLDFEDTFFIVDFEFQAASGTDVVASRHHPLLTLPFWLTEQDVAYLGADAGKSVCKPGYDPAQNMWGGSAPLNFDVLYPVVMNYPPTGNQMPSVAANHYGSGRVVATANFVGRGCYQYPPFDTPSIKFAFNVMAWASSWTHLRKDPRHSGNSIDTVGGTKLLEMWSLPLQSSPANKIESAPVIYKNVAFYSSGSTLFALDIMPQEDLDQDGNPDDGMPGLAGMENKGQDIIWVWEDPDGATLSAPSIVTAQNPYMPGATFEAVLVMSAAGKVHMLLAFPIDPNDPMGKRLAGATTSALPAPWTVGPPVSAPSPPLYQNGWIYAICGEGRLHAYNPSLAAYNAQNPGAPPANATWQVPGATFQGDAEPRCGPTYGFVKNETSGAITGMVYWFGGPWRAPGATPADAEQNDFVYGMPVFVANDRLKVERLDSTGTKAECRIAYREAFMSDSPTPKAWIDGVPATVTANTRLQNETNPGNDRGYVIIQSTSGTIPPSAIIYATYAVDYANHQVEFGNYVTNRFEAMTRLRVPLEPRSNGSNGVDPTKIVGMPAMGPDNMLFLNGERSTIRAGGSVYGLKNDGSTQYTRWSYHLHSGLTPADVQGASGDNMPIPAVIFDETTGAAMNNPKSFSSPAVSGDKVFVTVTGAGGGGPQAALACFKANSDFVIRITESAGSGLQSRQEKKPKRLINEATGREMQVKIWQPNLIGTPSAGIVVTPLIGAVPVPRDMIDYDRGVISFDNFDRLKLRGGTGNVMMTNTFSPSLPVWVFLDNVEVPIDFSTWGPTRKAASVLNLPIPESRSASVDLGGWNNLLWYYLVPDHGDTPCSGVHSSPVVIGNLVLFVCDDGYVYAIPADTGGTSGGQIKQDSAVWTTKVWSTAAGGSTEANLSPAGSNGVLLIPGTDGLHAFANVTTLVADSNRIVELDGAGDASWMIDNINYPVSPPLGPNTPPPATSIAVNKPARARYLEGGEILVVNSGSNQVFKIDKSGTVGIARTRAQISGNPAADGFVRWMWDRFIDPGRLLRPGQPTDIKGPTDALFWQEYDQGRMVYHCLVSDSGNHRVLDLIYRVKLDDRGNPEYLITSAGPDPSSGFLLPELNWVTYTDSTNERYVYECIQLVPNVDGNGVLLGHDIWAAVSNYRTGTDPANIRNQGLGGAIIALKYRNIRTGGGWDYNDPQAGRIVAACDRVNWGGEKPLAGPRFFQVVQKPAGRYLLICDNYGVYAARLGPSVPPVERFFTDGDYRATKRTLIKEDDNTAMDGCAGLGIPLMAASVQELPNGNWLITNGFAGSDETAGRVFSGEVFEVDLSGPSPEVKWNAPTLYTPFGKCEDVVLPWANPPIYDQGTWKQKMQKSYILQQPRCAFRQF